MSATSACPVCAGSGTHWATVRDRHYGNAGDWDVHACDACGARYLVPMPSPEQLGAYYPANYYSHHVMPVSASKSLAGRLRARLLPLDTREPAFETVGRMLDVGCGSGWMLERYRGLGWDVEGVEYSAAACDAGRSRGLTMHCGSLHDAQLGSEQFDYIRSNHSFEHLTNPVDTIAEMDRLLKPGGTIFIGVPDTMGLMARLCGSEWFYVGAPVHTINYNRRNLVELLRRHGFEIRSVRANSNHGGTVGSLQSRLGAALGRPVNLSRGPVTWKPLILVGLWVSKILDALRLGDCVEVIAVKPTDRGC